MNTELLERIKPTSNDYIGIITGDWHISGDKHISRKDNFLDSIHKKISEVIAVSNFIKADGIFVPGDMYNSTDVSDNIKGDTGHILQESKTAEIYYINGNHGVYGQNVKSYYRTPIGIFEKMNALTVIDEKKIFIKKGDLNIQISGTPYNPFIDIKDKEKSYCIKKEEGVTHAIHMVHGYLSPKKLLFNHTLISEIEQTEANITISGHFHSPFFEEVNNKFFINSGALARNSGARSDFRNVFITIFKITQSGEIFFYPYQLTSAKQAEEVLDRSHLEDDGKYFKELEQFSETISKVSNQKTLNPYEIITSISKDENIDTEVKEEALRLISFMDEKIESDISNRNYPVPEIYSLIIKYFQSHTDTRMTFAKKGITTIIGETDSGKTTIIRSLLNLLTNKFSQTEFMTQGKTHFEITGNLSNGYQTTRLRNKNINGYIHVNPEGEKISENGLQKGIPETTLEIIGTPFHTFGEGKTINLNFANQTEGPFLLNESKPMKALVIDTLAKTHLFNTSIKEIGSELSSLSNIKDGLQNQILKKEKEIETYEYLTEISSSLEKLKEIQSSLSNKKRILSLLVSLFSKLEDLKKDIAFEENLVVELSKVKSLENILYQLKDKDNLSKMLNKLNNQVEEINKNKYYYEEIIKSKSQIKKLEQLNIELSNKNILFSKLDSHNNHTIRLKSEIDNISSFISQSDKIIKLESIFINLSKKEENYKMLNANEYKLNFIYKEKNRLETFLNTKENILKLEKIYNDFTYKQRLLSNLKSLKFNLINMFEVREKLEYFLKSKENILRLEVIYNQFTYNQRLLSNLRPFNSNLSNIFIEKDKLMVFLNSKQSILKLDTILNSLISTSSLNKNLINLSFKLNELNDRINKGNKYCKELKGQVNTSEKQYFDKLKEINQCPTCGNRNISVEEVKKALNNY